MPVCVLSDSTLPEPSDGTFGGCYQRGATFVIASAGASLTTFGNVYPGTLLSLLVTYGHKISDLGPASLRLRCMALPAVGQVPPFREQPSYEKLNSLRERERLTKFPLRLVELDEAMKSSTPAKVLQKFPRLFGNRDCWNGLWNASSGDHVVRPAVAADFREDLLDALSLEAEKDELLLFLMAGWNCADAYLEDEVRVHASLAKLSTLGSLCAYLKSLGTGLPSSRAWLGDGPQLRVHQEWLPLLKDSCGMTAPEFRQTGSLAVNTIFILTVDPTGLGAEAGRAWSEAGFRAELVSGDLRPVVLPKGAPSPARLAWTLRFLPYVYQRTMAVPEHAWIFLAEDSARPVDGVKYKDVVKILRRDPSDSPCGHWLGYRSLKKSRTVLGSFTLLPGGVQLQVPTSKKEAFPIGSKFFAVSRLYLRHLFAVSLQMSPLTYQDHVHGELVSAGLLQVKVPSLCWSEAHYSHQDKTCVPAENQSTLSIEKYKVPQLRHFPQALWREASCFLTNGPWCFEPLLWLKEVHVQPGGQWSFRVTFPNNDAEVEGGWCLSSTSELSHYSSIAGA